MKAKSSNSQQSSCLKIRRTILLYHLGAPNEFGSQGRKIFDKLIPLIQLCKNQQSKPSHKKSFSISHTQTYKRASNKSTKRSVLKENSSKTNTSLYTVQAKTLGVDGKKRSLLVHHSRIRSEVTGPSQENGSTGSKKTKESSISYSKKRMTSKRSIVMTTPHSPNGILKKTAHANPNDKSQGNAGKTTAKKSVNHKRSTSDGYAVKKTDKKVEVRKSPLAVNKNESLTRPVSSSGNFCVPIKKPAPSFAWMKLEGNEKNVSTEFLLQSFGKFAINEDLKIKNSLERFKKNKCEYNNDIAISKKDYATDRDNAIEKHKKVMSKMPAVSVPQSKQQSVLNSPKLTMPKKPMPKNDYVEEPKVAPLSSDNLSKLSHQKDLEKLVTYIKNYFKEHNDAPPTTTEFYRIGRLLGKGAFGKVNLGMHKLTGKMVAIKSINKECLTDENSKQKVMKEFAILKLLKHQSVIRLYETFESKKHILFIVELCAGGDLLNYVRKRRRLKEPVAKIVFKQIIEGLQYCHYKEILHRDIKLDNILLNAMGHIKVGDFGVSRRVKKGERVYDQCGTPAYIAPEILRDKGYEGFAADIWSAGVALYAILYGTVPFKGNDMKSLQKQILKGKYVLKDDISMEARDLLRRMLEVDPNKRITENEILNHHWIRQGAGHKNSLFTEVEKETIRKEYSYVKKSTNGTDTGTLFTEQNIDSTQNELTKNATTKSVILAPFNSTQSDFSNSNNAPAVEKKCVIKFGAKVRDVDREYEKNNNGDLDNGVYNKLMESSKEKSLYESNDSLEGSFGEDVEPQCSGILDEEPETTVAPYTEERQKEKLNEEIIKQLENLGYPKKYIVTCIEEGKMNYGTAAYYLLLNDV